MRMLLLWWTMGAFSHKVFRLFGCRQNSLILIVIAHKQIWVQLSGLRLRIDQNILRIHILRDKKERGKMRPNLFTRHGITFYSERDGRRMNHQFKEPNLSQPLNKSFVLFLYLKMYYCSTFSVYIYISSSNSEEYYRFVFFHAGDNILSHFCLSVCSLLYNIITQPLWAK